MVIPYHLCQPDEEKSCAACCGLYNYKDNSRVRLVSLLREHTTCLERGNRLNAGFLRRYSRRYQSTANGAAKLFPTIFNCEYVGFLDTDERRVGCLLHPAQRQGCDYRHLSFHGKSLCADHLCLSYFYLTRQEQEMVIKSVDDWYLYGLLITDIDFVKTYCRHLNNRLGHTFDPQVMKHQYLKETVGLFFSLKLNWPFRSSDVNRFGKYRFCGEVYQQARIDYRALGLENSPYGAIFLSLASEFGTGHQVEEAEALIDGHLRRFVDAYQGLFPHRCSLR